MRRKLLGNEHQDVAPSLANLAILLDSEGKLSEAEAMYREALPVRAKLPGSEQSNVATWLGNLANLLERQGKISEIGPMFDDLLTPVDLTQPKSAPLLRQRAD